MQGGRFLGPPVFTQRNQRHAALETFRSANPDRGGRISGILTIGLVAVLLAAAFSLGFLWVNMPRHIRANEKRLAHEQVRVQVLQAYVDGTAIPECNCTPVAEHDFPGGFADDEFQIFNADDSDKTLLIDVSAMLSAPHTVAVQDGDGVVAYLSDIPTYPTAFADDEFELFNSGDLDKRVSFDLSGLDPSTLIELAIQPVGGTIAYLSDVPTMSAVFQDDVFAIQHAAEQTREIQFDVPELGSGTTTITMAVQDADGVIAYEADLWQNRDEFSDAEFLIHAAGDTSALLQFDLAAVDAGSTVTMAVQNVSGTVAYTDDVPELQIAWITEDRSFPDPGIEGYANFSAMGVERVAISLCGGGGSGSALIVEADGIEEYNGGGGGAGYYQFTIDDVATQYERFDITIGAGGTSSSISTLCTASTRGGATSLLGIPAPGSQYTNALILTGFGGGCTTEINLVGEFYGGCGAGTDSTGTVQPGFAGDMGGVPGSCGTIPDEEAHVPPVRYPWFGGAHGGAWSNSTGGEHCTGAGECPASGTLVGGRRGRGRAGGAGGMFGHGGNSEPEFPGEADAPAFSCAGGGSPEALQEVDDGTFVGWSRGGAGQVMIEYWFAPTP